MQDSVFMEERGQAGIGTLYIIILMACEPGILGVPEERSQELL